MEIKVQSDVMQLVQHLSFTDLARAGRVSVELNEQQKEVNVLEVGTNLGLHGEDPDRTIPGEAKETRGRTSNIMIAQKVRVKEKHQARAHGKELAPRCLEQFTLPNGRKAIRQPLTRSSKKRSPLTGHFI